MAPRLANTLVIDNGAATIKAGFASRSATIDDSIDEENPVLVNGLNLVMY